MEPKGSSHLSQKLYLERTLESKQHCLVANDLFFYVAKYSAHRKMFQIKFIDTCNVYFEYLGC